MHSSEPPQLSPITRLAQTFSLLTLEAASLGMAIWSLVNWSRLPGYLANNQLSPESRQQLLLWMLGSVAIVCTAVIAHARGRNLQRMQTLAQRLAPLSVAGLLPILVSAHVGHLDNLTFLVMLVILGLGLRVALLAAWQAPALGLPQKPAWLPGLPWLPSPTTAVLLLTAWFVAYFALISAINHHNLHTSSFDLGLEENLIWNLLHRDEFPGPLFKSSPFAGPEGSHFGHHATFFAFCIAQIYRFAPYPETLLFIQALLAGLAAIPLYLLARRRFSARAAVCIAAVYLLYPPLHGSLLYDFHYQPLAIFFLWMCLWGIDSGRYVTALIFALVALSVREDVGFLMAALGAYLLFSRRAPVAGLLMGIAGTGYFLLMKFYFMPQFLGGSESFIHQYQGLLGPGQSGFAGVLKTILANPAYTLQTLLERDKLVYFLQIAAPLAFLPFIQPVALLCAVPGLIFTLMSTGYEPLYQISFQYTAYWTSCIFIALVFNLEDVARPKWTGDVSGPLRQRVWLVTLLVVAILASLRYGALVPHPGVRAGFGEFRFGTNVESRRNYNTLTRLTQKIPPLAKVAASENLVAHIAARPDAYTLRQGLYDAEYLLFTLPARDDERRYVKPALASGEYGVVAIAGPFALAQRGHPPTLNLVLLDRL